MINVISSKRRKTNCRCKSSKFFVTWQHADFKQNKQTRFSLTTARSLACELPSQMDGYIYH